MPNQHTITLVRPLIRDYINSMSSREFESSIGLVPPLGLCYLASSLEESGYSVSLFDGETPGHNEQTLIEYLNQVQPSVVGISMVTTNFFGALHTAKLIRKTLPHACVVGGGPHLMLFPQETMSYDVFDFCFIGEAEEPLVRFMQTRLRKNPDWSAIPGLVWRNGSKIEANEPFGFNPDLNKLPAPAYNLLDLTAYTMPNTQKPVMSTNLSRGCPFSCSFCFRGPQLKIVRYKSIDKALNEIEHIVTTTSIRSINFVDETITLDKDYFLSFCNGLIFRNLNIEWQSPTRVNCLDDEILSAAKASGCHTLRLGVESGNDQILKNINKGITTEQSRRAVHMCRKHGIKTVTYFIIGYLDETEQTINNTIRFAKKLSPDFAAFFPATPMPGTKLHQQASERGLISENYWQDYVLGKRNDPVPYICPDAGRWTSKAYRAFYFSPGYIAAQLTNADFYKQLPRNIKIACKLLTTSTRAATS
ncbi:MAG: radical SAM protein [bacterium]|nr:radical SAM protein [bacterium]